MWHGEVVVQKARSVEEECRGREKAGSARRESEDEVWQARGTRAREERERGETLEEPRGQRRPWENSRQHWSIQ